MTVDLGSSASTTPTDVDSSIPELWSRLVLHDQLRGGFWTKQSGPEGSGSAIIPVQELLTGDGDTINIQITDPLSGSGVEGDTTLLQGSEENLSSTSIKTIPRLYRNAVRWYGRAAKKSIIDLRSEGKMRLAEWGQEKLDDVRFANFTSTANLNGEVYTPNTLSVGGGSNVPGDIGTTDLLDVETIMKAKLTAYNNRAIPLTTSDGEEFFAMVCHPNSIYNLKRSDEYKDWVREAGERGATNPFFRGAIAMIDGVLLFQHNNVPTALDGVGNISVSRNLLYGKEAFVEGFDQGVTWNEDDFDYGNEFGVAYGFGFQPRRGLAKNSLVVYAVATAP